MLYNRDEEQLIVLCARTQIKNEEEQRIRELLKKPLDWEFVVETARQQRLTSLLFENLRKISPSNVPQDKFDQLRAAAQSITTQNLMLTGAMVQIVQVFAKQDIPVIALKGPMTASAVYGNIALREFNDLDMLVEDAHLKSALKALAELGYELNTEKFEGNENAYLKQYYLYQFVSPAHNFYLELHWRLLPRSFSSLGDPDAFIKNAHTVEFQHIDLLTPSPEDLLLFLCAHGAKHLWSRFSWICDVAELTRAFPQMNWDYVVAQSKVMRGNRELLLGLCLARDVLDANIPEDVLTSRPNDRTLKSLLEQVERNLFIPESVQPMNEWFFHTRMRESWSDKIRYNLRVIEHRLSPTIRERSMIRVGPQFEFVYWFLRFFHLIQLAVSRSTKRLWSKREEA